MRMRMLVLMLDADDDDDADAAAGADADADSGAARVATSYNKPISECIPEFASCRARFWSVGMGIATRAGQTRSECATDET